MSVKSIVQGPFRSSETSSIAMVKQQRGPPRGRPVSPAVPPPRPPGFCHQVDGWKSQTPWDGDDFLKGSFQSKQRPSAVQLTRHESVPSQLGWKWLKMVENGPTKSGSQTSAWCFLTVWAQVYLYPWTDEVLLHWCSKKPLSLFYHQGTFGSHIFVWVLKTLRFHQ